MNSILKKSDFPSICRICFKKDLSLNCLFQTDAANMLIFCGFLEIIKNDELPQNICTSCFDLLVESYKLKQLCNDSILFYQTFLATTQENIGDLHSEVYEEQDETPELHAQQLENPGDSNLVNNDETQSLLEDKSPNIMEILMYKCGVCKSEFKTDKDLVVHQSIHGTELKCNACGKLFHSIKILKRHLKTHMTTKPHLCKICNKSFVESWDVIRHSKRHHLGILREKKYKCRECNQSFTDQYYLNVHQRKHTGEKPLKCSECQKAFYDPRSLKTHINSHKGIKPYLCSFCGKSFLQNAHLRQHIVVHDRKKPFSCKVCGKQFTQAASVLRHQKVHKER